MSKVSCTACKTGNLKLPRVRVPCALSSSITSNSRLRFGASPALYPQRQIRHRNHQADHAVLRQFQDPDAAGVRGGVAALRGESEMRLFERCGGREPLPFFADRGYLRAVESQSRARRDLQFGDRRRVRRRLQPSARVVGAVPSGYETDRVRSSGSYGESNGSLLLRGPK